MRVGLSLLARTLPLLCWHHLSGVEAVAVVAAAPSGMAAASRHCSRNAAVRLAVKGAAKGKTIALNRLARRNYEILDDYEAGVSLVGTEVKSCRLGQCNLRDG